MFKKLCLLSTSLVLLSGIAYAEEPTPYNCDFSPSCEVAPGVYGAMASPVMSKFKLSIGGYVKMDYVHNLQNVGPTLPASGLLAVKPAAGYKDESLITAKQSRLWFKVAGPTLLGAKTNALVEFDFYGATTLPNDMGNVRMRHAMLTMDWANTQLLFGQFWDIFGPAAADTIDFRQGAPFGTPNNPRVPQLRLTQMVHLGAANSLKLVLGAQNAVENAGDYASSSTLAGTYGSMVNVAGQAMFVSKGLGVSPGMMGLGMAPLQLGVFGIYGNGKLAANHLVKNYGYGAYAFVPVLKSRDGKSRAMTLSFEGQVYASQGLDVLAANNNGLVGAAPDQGGAKGNGFYAQLKMYPTQNLGVTIGHMARFAPDADEFSAAYAGSGAAAPAGYYSQKNQLSYGNLTYDLNAAIRLAAEYEHAETRYGKVGATNLLGYDNTIRAAAYYFF